MTISFSLTPKHSLHNSVIHSNPTREALLLFTSIDGVVKVSCDAIFNLFEFDFLYALNSRCGRFFWRFFLNFHFGIFIFFIFLIFYLFFHFISCENFIKTSFFPSFLWSSTNPRHLAKIPRHFQFVETTCCWHSTRVIYSTYDDISNAKLIQSIETTICWCFYVANKQKQWKKLNILQIITINR